MIQYVVTAINRLTQEREAVSVPRSYHKTRMLLLRWKNMTKNCQEPAWTDLRVERFKEDMVGQETF